MGCSNSKDAVAPPRSPKKQTKGVQKVGQQLTEEDLKKILMERQEELSSRARPLLECTVLMKDDIHEHDPSHSVEYGNSEYNKQNEHSKVKEHVLYKIAKREDADKWVIFDDLPDYTCEDMQYLMSFKNLVLEYMPKLVDDGAIHSVGVGFLNKKDTPVSSVANSTSPSVSGDDVEEEEEEEVITIKRQNSKFIDVKQTVIAKFGSLDNIPETKSTVTATTPEKNKGGGEALKQLRRPSGGGGGGGGGDTIQVPRQNSVEKLLGMGNLKIINSNTVPLPNDIRNKITIDKNVNLGVSKSQYQRKQKVLSEYELPKGPMTLQSALEIYETYKQGGRCSRSTVHKVLRNAYRSLKDLPNTNYVRLKKDDCERLTVVGDIHGQLHDLLHILEESGTPTECNKYIFNGDFVDRGPMGLEVTIILMAFHAVLPKSVFLNRGNHEDYAICCVYGFQDECNEKYDEVTFGMFVEVFQFLPLFTVVNDSVLVVHGGLFHSPVANLKELDAINRSDFTLKDLPQNDDDLMDVPVDRKEYLKQLQRDALWSDPSAALGLSMSPRGAGVGFGPDITRAFLERNNLRMVVRSHECVQEGYDFPYVASAKAIKQKLIKAISPNKNRCIDDDDEEIAEEKVIDPCMLCTVFSASNYGGNSDNQGAYMVFAFGNGGKIPSPPTSSLPTKADEQATVIIPHHNNPALTPVHSARVTGMPELSYAVYQYSITAEVEARMRKTFMVKSWSIFDVVSKKYKELMGAFKLLDTAVVAAKETGDADQKKNPVVLSGRVSFNNWANVMQHVTNIDLRWITMIPIIVAEPYRFADTSEVEYGKFLDEYINNYGRDHTNVRATVDNDGVPINDNTDPEEAANLALVESLYIHHKQLEIVFNYFDVDLTGNVTRQQIIDGCNKLHAECVAENPEYNLCTHDPNPHLTLEDVKVVVPDDHTPNQCDKKRLQFHDTEAVDKLFHLLDIDEDQKIDVNEFFEVFRIIDIKLNKRK